MHVRRDERAEVTKASRMQCQTGERRGSNFAYTEWANRAGRQRAAADSSRTGQWRRSYQAGADITLALLFCWLLVLLLLSVLNKQRRNV